MVQIGCLISCLLIIVQLAAIGILYTQEIWFIGVGMCKALHVAGKSFGNHFYL